MGLGYALSENFTSTGGIPDSLGLRDVGLVPAKHMPEVDVILIEVPDEVGGYGAKGVGEIGCVATAGRGRRRVALLRPHPPCPPADGRRSSGSVAAAETAAGSSIGISRWKRIAAHPSLSLPMVFSSEDSSGA
jgi:hypothetical protein